MLRSKQCFKCRAIKPLNEYYKHSAMADGHLNKCKACTKDDVMRHRLANLEKVRAYDRERSKQQHRIQHAREVTKAWRAEDKRRTACHNAVHRAIKAGLLVRFPCEKCSAEKSVAHHEDYDQPLAVRWLCQACHVQHHKALLQR
jgi:ribosomal protein S27AE